MKTTLLATLILILTACSKTLPNVGLTSGHAEGAAKPSVDGSFLSSCANGKIFVATFAPEGNWVDRYDFNSDECNGEARRTRLSVQPVAQGAPADDKLTISLPGQSPSSIEGHSVDSWYSYGGFHMKYAGKSAAGPTSERYYYEGPYNEFYEIRWDAQTPTWSNGEDWVSSSTEKFSWDSNCPRFEKITVGAGRFNTCVRQIGDYKVWSGNTPLFDIVKVEYTGKDQSQSSMDYSVEQIHISRSSTSFELDEMAY